MKVKPFIAILLIVIGSLGVAAQTDSARVLATIKGRPFTEQQLPAESKSRYNEIQKALADERSKLLETMIVMRLVELETAARDISGEELYEIEIGSKVTEPNDETVNSVYEANKPRLNNRPLAEVKDQIVTALKQRQTQELQIQFIESLKTKYKFTTVREVGAPGLKLDDTLVTVGGEPITFGEFQSVNAGELFEIEEAVFLLERAELERALLLNLAELEAIEKGVTASAFIASEVTDKMKQFTDEERQGLETALRGRLFEKYEVRLAISAPDAPSVQVSVDDDPFMGPEDAPVQMIMFTDFQCPACARMEPLLKSMAIEFKDSVRFVVRDFPLESIHPNAFNAALAANAAAKQNKYFEYGSLLYTNQRNLGDESLKGYARQLGLDMEKFEKDFSDPAAAQEIRADIAAGRALQISGTPTIFINGIRLRDFSADGIRNLIRKGLGGRDGK
jgi:protein-disulfide isomerase